MPVERVQNVTLGYHDVGHAAQVVVLIHGFPFSSNQWQPQLGALGARHRVIAPDLRGFGDSEATPGPYTMDLLADDVSGLLDRLGVERAVIGGLSMGGYVAFEFYRRHPERVSAMVLADTRPEADSAEARSGRERMAELAQTAGSHAVAEQLLPKLLAASTLTNQPQVVSALQAMMVSATPRAIGAALEGMALRGDSLPLLPEITVPVLVVNGAQDAIAPPDHAREWARHIPDARVEIIESAGHVSSMEQPEMFNRIVLGFLAESVGN